MAAFLVVQSLGLVQAINEFFPDVPEIMPEPR